MVLVSLLFNWPKEREPLLASVVGAAAIKMAAGLGSDITMDYRQENVLERGPVFDAVIDLSGKMNYRAAKAILKKKTDLCKHFSWP